MKKEIGLSRFSSDFTAEYETLSHEMGFYSKLNY